MEKTMVSITTGVFIGLLLFAAAVNITEHQKNERQVSDRCWVQGGEYRNGTCEKHIPGTKLDKFEDEGLVCMAKKGSYMIKGEDFKCYGDGGEEKQMPDLTGKKVIVLTDGTVLLQDR